MKTLSATIRGLRERDLAKTRSQRYRTRRREGYARTGPADIPPEIVWAMVERGILPWDQVTWDRSHRATAEGTPHVDPRVLNQAMCRLLDMIAARPDEFLDFLKDDPATRGIPWRQIYDRTFQRAIGLPRHAAAMRHDVVMRAYEDHGFEVIVKKKSLGDD